MSSVPFHYIDLRTFCYATEDDQRVEDALRTFLPEEFEIQRAASEGHHGDRIFVLSGRVENTNEMRTVLERLTELPEAEFKAVQNELDERVTENTEFFLTLSKQAAFNGDVERGDGIKLRAKVEAYPAKKQHAIENVETVLETLEE
jgi:RNA binding exosome subunit